VLACVFNIEAIGLRRAILIERYHAVK